MSNGRSKRAASSRKPASSAIARRVSFVCGAERRKSATQARSRARNARATRQTAAASQAGRSAGYSAASAGSRPDSAAACSAPASRSETASARGERGQSPTSSAVGPPRLEVARHGLDQARREGRAVGVAEARLLGEVVEQGGVHRATRAQDMAEDSSFKSPVLSVSIGAIGWPDPSVEALIVVFVGDAGLSSAGVSSRAGLYRVEVGATANQAPRSRASRRGHLWRPRAASSMALASAGDGVHVPPWAMNCSPTSAIFSSRLGVRKDRANAASMRAFGCQWWTRDNGA